jgi:hypothetical protein
MPKGARVVRLVMAAGLFVEFVGFLYDKVWHDLHLSMVAIPPGKLLTIHGGIYAGELLVLAVAIIALARVPFRLAARLALWLVVAGGLVELVGAAGDMWTHGHGYELSLLHNLILLGAGTTLAGYLLVELFSALETRTGTADEPQAELVGSGVRH